MNIGCNVLRFYFAHAVIFGPINHDSGKSDFKHVPWMPTAVKFDMHRVASNKRLGGRCI